MNESIINVQVSDFVLTPMACASLINETLRNLLYQKCQLPYTYNWLQNLMNKKKQNAGEKSSSKTYNNYTVQNHLRTVCTAYDSLESITNSITEEFKSPKDLKEISFVFGCTPLCPKEVFTMKFPQLDYNHSESKHMSETSRRQHRILRQIFFSPPWMDLITKTLPCTNTYVFLRRSTEQNGASRTNPSSDSVFIASKPLSVHSAKIPHTIVNLHYDIDSVSRNISCCGNLNIFCDDDSGDETSISNICDGSESSSVGNAQSNSVNDIVMTQQGDDDERTDKNSDLDEFWLQSKVRFQGFKDCYINKVSVCDLW